MSYRVALALALVTTGAAAACDVSAPAAFGFFGHAPAFVEHGYRSIGIVTRRPARPVLGLRLSPPGGKNGDNGTPAGGASDGQSFGGDNDVHRVDSEVVSGVVPDSLLQQSSGRNPISRTVTSLRNQARLVRSASWITVLAGVIDGMAAVRSLRPRQGLTSCEASATGQCDSLNATAPTNLSVACRSESYRPRALLFRSSTCLELSRLYADSFTAARAQITSIASGSALLAGIALLDISIPSIAGLGFMLVCGMSCLATSFAVPSPSAALPAPLPH
jgi:hypothetical protein